MESVIFSFTSFRKRDLARLFHAAGAIGIDVELYSGLFVLRYDRTFKDQVDVIANFNDCFKANLKK